MNILRTSLAAIIAFTLLVTGQGLSEEVTQEEDIEMLDIIEVPGTAIAKKPRKLTYPTPDSSRLYPLPVQDLFDIPVDIPIERKRGERKLLVDAIGKSRGIRSPVRPIKAERPSYPRFAREQGWKGLTIVRMTIKADGTVASAKTHKSSGYPLLDQNAIQTVKGWMFEPAKNGTFAIASTIDLPIRFDLDK